MFRYVLVVLNDAVFRAKWPLNRLVVENSEIGAVLCQFSPAFASSSISRLYSFAKVITWTAGAQQLYEHGYQNEALYMGCYVFIWRFIHESFARYCWYFSIFAFSNFSPRENINSNPYIRHTDEKTVIAQMRWHICSCFCLKQINGA